jgi:hypothetical protein
MILKPEYRPEKERFELSVWLDPNTSVTVRSSDEATCIQLMKDRLEDK